MIQLIRRNHMISFSFMSISFGLLLAVLGASECRAEQGQMVESRSDKTLIAAKLKKGIDPSKVKNKRRVDFRLKGSKCASCLGRIRKRMAKLDAVLDAAVIIKKPYGGAAIYDGDKITVAEILKAALKNEKVKVEIVDVNDRKIAKMPFILVPKINQLKKK